MGFVWCRSYLLCPPVIVRATQYQYQYVNTFFSMEITAENQCEKQTHIRVQIRSTFSWLLVALNPFRTAVPFWGQTTWKWSRVSPKRDCGSKRVNRRVYPVFVLRVCSSWDKYTHCQYNIRYLFCTGIGTGYTGCNYCIIPCRYYRRSSVYHTSGKERRAFVWVARRSALWFLTSAQSTPTPPPRTAAYFAMRATHVAVHAFTAFHRRFYVHPSIPVYCTVYMQCTYIHAPPRPHKESQKQLKVYLPQTKGHEPKTKHN